MAGSRTTLGAALAAVAFTTALVVAADTPTVPNATVNFDRQIRPLLSDRCFRCHGPDSAKRKAKLRLDTKDGAMAALKDGWAIVKPFDPGKSELIRRIFNESDDERMPPPESHLSLSPAERELLRRWVTEGAEYRPHWSFIPVGEIPLPATSHGSLSTNPIDAFVRERLDAEGIAPAPEASPEALLRRLSLNLTGLPPTIAELDAFLANASPAAYEKAVDRYLASPAYGERMAVDWLDLARYADTYGYQNDFDRDVSPYRDWVIRAFNQNLPYDAFLTWQLAGDLLPAATREQRIATAFNRMHRQTNEGGSVEEEFRTEYIVDRVNTFGTAMLGLTIECARCHDHKFDPITQRDYYSLFAFFNNIDESGLYSHFTNATPTPTLMLWTPAQSARHRQLQGQIAASEARLAALERSARRPFAVWKKTARVHAPAPIAHLAFDEAAADTTPDSATGAEATLQDGPVIERESQGRTVDESKGPSDGAVGRLAGPDSALNGAMRFSGDNAVIDAGVRTFTRSDPFSIVLRLQPTEAQDRAVIVHQSRAWSDAGSRGFELTLDHGRPLFALTHFWPGNAIAVRATRDLPLHEWSRIAVTYDGSSRAAGIRLYLNGAPLATDVVRDHLYKDITYSKAAGDGFAEKAPLTLGARFRDSGFKNGLIDDLGVFDVALTPIEIADGGAGAAAGDLFEYYVARVYAPAKAEAAELQRLRREDSRLVNRVREIMVMEEMATPRPAHLLARGAYDAPRDEVPRDTPSALPPFDPELPRNRLGLARWLTGRQNPLAARVAVNRIWRMHFGRGLVASQEDFGSQGRLPSHPELLDWLAARFMDSGWDVKALQKLIVTSATFKQSSHAAPEQLAKDPENRLLSRGPTTRMSAEEIRDSALAASGLLTSTVGGPSVKPYQPAGLWEQSGTGKTYVQDHGDKLYRRSLYTFWRRTSPPPSMLTFDAMSREVCTAKREVTNTPLQALVLLNDPQFVEASRALAGRLLRTFPNNPSARNRDAFRTLIGRVPDAEEAAILARLFIEQRDLFAASPHAARSVVRIGESVPDPLLPPADYAAMTTVVSAIMNFDEFVMER